MNGCFARGQTGLDPTYPQWPTQVCICVPYSLHHVSLKLLLIFQPPNHLIPLPRSLHKCPSTMEIFHGVEQSLPVVAQEVKWRAICTIRMVLQYRTPSHGCQERKTGKCDGEGWTVDSGGCRTDCGFVCGHLASDE